MEERSRSKKKEKDLLERLRQSSPAAIAGAFVSFASAATGAQPKPPVRPEPDPSLVQISLSEARPVRAPIRLELEYRQAQALGAAKFRRSLQGISIGPGDTIFALGDGEVKVLKPDGTTLEAWKAPEGAACIAAGRDDRIYIGRKGRVEGFDGKGKHRGGFGAGDPGRPADVTAVKLFGRELLVADAAARLIRRCDLNGKQLGTIGAWNKVKGFMLPNGALDLDVDSKGIVAAADPGRHRVTLWNLDGSLIGHFGKFGLASPGDFVGCCNPVNLAFAPDGRIVVSEKVAGRVKVYDRAGKLLAVIGPEHFDPKCARLHLAVDSKGRILVADPVRLEIKVFSLAGPPGGREDV